MYYKIYVLDHSSDFVCEPDEYAKLVQEIKESGIIGDNRKGLFKQKRTFTGKSLIDYLMKKQGVGKTRSIYI